MNVILLSPYPERIERALRDAGDHVAHTTTLPICLYTCLRHSGQFIVSYGYRHILKPPLIGAIPAINLHISFLPWNRGADPNFWSWHDGTPKGVTIHAIDEGIDTGPIYAQETTVFRGRTLAETYLELHEHICDLFARTWPSIRDGALAAKPQAGQGSYHRSADRPEVDWSMAVGDIAA